MDHGISESGEPKYLIIPAAGLGTRMKSVNADLPKELLPVGGKPAIQYAVEEGLSAGIQEMVILISTQKDIVRNYFEDKTMRRSLYPGITDEMNEILRKVSFHFLYQKMPMGESDAISYAGDIAGGHSVAIIHPDDIYFPAPGVLRELKTTYNQYKTDVIALMSVTDKNAAGLGNSGRVDLRRFRGNLYYIEQFIPKRRGGFVSRFKGELRSCGMSISGPHIFKYIEKVRTHVRKGEFTNQPVLEAILKERGFLGHHLPGIHFDIGNPKGYELSLQYIQDKI